MTSSSTRLSGSFSSLAPTGPVVPARSASNRRRPPPSSWEVSWGKLRWGSGCRGRVDCPALAVSEASPLGNPIRRASLGKPIRRRRRHTERENGEGGGIGRGRLRLDPSRPHNHVTVAPAGPARDSEPRQRRHGCDSEAYDGRVCKLRSRGPIHAAAAVHSDMSLAFSVASGGLNTLAF